MKHFTTNGACIPEQHYMMDLSEKTAVMARMVEEGKYFTIDRPLMGGRTTILDALSEALSPQYLLLRLDLARAPLDSAADFTKWVSEQLLLQAGEPASEESGPMGDRMPDMIRAALTDLRDRAPEHVFLLELFIIFEQWFSMSVKPAILMADNAERAFDRQVFWDFVSMLRSGYIHREKGAPAFRSVIFASVIDLRFAELVMGDAAGKLTITPWDVASDLEADLDFGEEEIGEMLREWAAAGTDAAVPHRILELTGGHPYLVSRLSSIMEELAGEKPLTKSLAESAALQLMTEDNRLRQRMTELLTQSPGSDYPDNPDPGSPDTARLMAYGFLRYEEDGVRPANPVFEKWMGRRP